MNSSGAASAKRLSAVKNFSRRHRTKFALAALFAFILSVLALVQGVGFTASARVTYTQILVQGHECGNVVPYCDEPHSSCMCLLGFAHEGSANVTFNPLLYPVNHMVNREVSRGFSMFSKSVPDVYLKEIMITNILVSEFPVNFPFLYIFGLVLATGLEQLVNRIWGKRSTKEAQSVEK